MKFIIKLNRNNAVIGETIDWIPALRLAALEIQDLNAYSGTTEFPRPIASNPDSVTVEGFLGCGNTPPTEDRGMVTVAIDEYEWLELDLFPAMPTTFSFAIGDPPAGKIIE